MFGVIHLLYGLKPDPIGNGKRTGLKLVFSIRLKMMHIINVMTFTSNLFQSNNRFRRAFEKPKEIFYSNKMLKISKRKCPALLFLNL